MKMAVQKFDVFKVFGVKNWVKNLQILGGTKRFISAERRPR